MIAGQHPDVSVVMAAWAPSHNSRSMSRSCFTPNFAEYALSVKVSPTAYPLTAQVQESR